MGESLRKSGIDVIGDVPWGTHFCQFYQTREDLVGILVPYFKAGLENNEFCIWVTSQVQDIEEAKEDLKRAIPAIDAYMEKGQIEIIPYTDWYLTEVTFDPERVLNSWVEKLNSAMEDSYEGLRFGNTLWLEKENWHGFAGYEKEADNIIGNHRIIALCTYSLDRCKATEIIDAAINHQFSLIKREGKWEQIESPRLKKAEETVFQASKEAEANLKEAHDNLEKLVEERTVQLEKAYKALKESEEGLAEAQKMAHIGSWTWNIATGELQWSDEVYCIFGRGPQEFGSTYNSFLKYVHPEDRDYVIDAIKKGLSEEPQSIDYRILLPDGEERTVHTQAEIILDENNIPVRAKGIVQDITERRKTEEALRLSNIYNRRLVEASLDPLVTIGLDGKIADTNVATELITGYSRDELIGTRSSDYFTEPEKVIKAYKQVLVQGEIRDYPLEIQHRDGYITPVLVNASVYKDENGKVRGVFASVHDITERKKAEEKIQMLANVVESSDDAIITKSLDGMITSWNRGAEQIYGYSAEEVLGKNVSIIEPENLKGETKQLAEKIEQGEKIHHSETLRLKKDGTIINISITLSPVFDVSGELIAVSTIARNTTERRKAEEALRLSNIYNRSLIEASLDPLVTIGPDGKITDVNAATELITGYSRDELIGTDFSDYFTEPEEASKGYQQVFVEGEVRDYPLEIQHRDGHITPVLYNASVYKDESGKVIGVFAAARDITELKKTEEVLKQKMGELARKREIHHRIKNNLQVISSLLALQAEKLGSKEYIKRSEILEAFRESQDRVASIALIHEELHEGGESDTLSFSPYIERLVENLFHIYRFENVDIRLKTDMEEDVFFDMDTAVPLGIIVNELVSNSLKHAFSGRKEGEIQIKLHRQEVSRSKRSSYGSRRERDIKRTEFTLIVLDNGVGIPEAVDFENSDTLGLQLVSILVEQLDGELELKRDNGTEFTIRISVRGNS
ncbi:PAS domain S-box protein [Methanosarcina sp. DH2]|uniref:PAS domain S-box protein n=1 Tax=Methanosarcina sp. DH2 TaxID=2605639 RepID=UPI001E307C5A|nr:PAS domain S-box protein [Methanosarcina sp. DH2]MCC4769113.1 PAS domain S-box protein [Methanosarcina sp. DH2]